MLIRLLLILAVSFGAYAQPSPEQKKPKATKAAQPTKDDKRGTADAPLIIEVLPAKDAEKKAAIQQRHEDKKTFYEGLIAYGTVALALITLCLAFYTARLWKATVTLGDDASKTSVRQAADMKKSLRIAEDSATAAKESADAIVATSMPVLFPFVTNAAGTLYPVVRIQEGQTFTPELHFVFQNFGGTPGLIRDIRAELILQNDIPPYPSIDFEKLQATNQQKMVPGHTIGASAILPGSDVTCRFRPITPAEHAELLKAAEHPYLRFYLAGRVVYDDVFGNRHATTFFHKVRLGGYHEPHGPDSYNTSIHIRMPKEEKA